jgi:hypothetical protein
MSLREGSGIYNPSIVGSIVFFLIERVALGLLIPSKGRTTALIFFC